MSRPFVSSSLRYFSTFLMSSASWPRLASSQNTAGVLVRRARRTPSLTQSRIGSSFTWHMRKTSPLLDLLLHQDRAVLGDDADGAGRGEFEGLVVAAVLLGLLGHQADVRHRAHRLRIEGAVRLAVVDDGLEQRRVAAIGDRGDDVMQLAVGAPHLARLADHRRHRGIDDHVAGDVEVGDALVGIDHGEARAASRTRPGCRP